VPIFDPATLFDLTDQVAVVTGASSGLGEHFAEVLHAAGARVVVSARRKERLTALAERLPGTLAVPGDVSIDFDRESLVEQALSRFGRIDVLVNNAGIADHRPSESVGLETFENVISVNLTSAFALAQRTARGMLERGSGSIINVASIYGTVANRALPHPGYSASKGGLVTLTRQLAAEWAARGVRVNALAPGWFHTEMTGPLVESERGGEWVRRHIPMGRIGTSTELDGALLFLASGASSYCTGSVLTVDGGYTAV
jgi:NAD(P)-dependent dehydrogenase (short-subunit alcohol dehydrogenase family)